MKSFLSNGLKNDFSKKHRLTTLSKFGHYQF